MTTIILCDIGGIQNYLYNIKKNKSATKRLKWRSFFIKLLLKKISSDLQKDFWTKKILESWGKSILSCEKFSQNDFDRYIAWIKEKVFFQFYGELQVYFGVAKLNQDNFQTSLQEAFSDLEKNKKQPYQEVLQTERWKRNESIFIFDDKRWTDSVCTFTRGDLMKRQLQDKDVDEGVKDILEEENVKGISLNAYNDIIISTFLAWNKKNISIEILWESILLQEKDKKHIHLPKNNNNSIKSFEELAGEKWYNKLACLKGDIDDLGNTFMNRLKEEGYQQNYKTLSQKLDTFWDKKLYEIIWNREIYVVYAWGDDFVMLGRRNVIIDFYSILLTTFQEEIWQSSEIKNLLKDDKDIHFSTAIEVFGAHDTFFTVVKQTEKLLNEAKQKDDKKDKINIFGQIISNRDWGILIEETMAFRQKYLTKDMTWRKVVSVGTLRFLLKIAKKILLEQTKDEKTNTMEYIMRRAELFYHLGRNYRSKKWDKAEDDFRKYFETMLLQNQHNFILLWSKEQSNFFCEQTGEKLLIMMSFLLYQERDLQ